MGNRGLTKLIQCVWCLGGIRCPFHLPFEIFVQYFSIGIYVYIYVCLYVYNGALNGNIYYIIFKIVTSKKRAVLAISKANGKPQWGRTENSAPDL